MHMSKFKRQNLSSRNTPLPYPPSRKPHSFLYYVSPYTVKILSSYLSVFSDNRKLSKKKLIFIRDLKKNNENIVSYWKSSPYTHLDSLNQGMRWVLKCRGLLSIYLELLIIRAEGTIFLLLLYTVFL